MKQSLDKDAIAFLPDALAIRHSVLPWWARYTLIWMAVFFLLAVLWSCFGRVDIIVETFGKLVSNHPTIVMNPLERTAIKGIHVAVGDRVQAGDILATFDPVFSDADRKRLAAEVRVQEARFSRISAEFDKRQYILPPEPTEEDFIQLKIYLDRQRYYAEKQEYFIREIERIKKTRISLQENLVLQNKRLAGYRDIEDMMRKARSTQAVSPRDLKEAQLSRMQLEADISDKENNMLVLDSELLAKEAESKAFSTDWEIAIAEELAKTQAALTSARKEFDKAQRMMSYVELRAPEDAVVHDIVPMSIGSAVREAETLITLVPLGGTLEVEAEIRAEDIGKIQVGDSCRIKLSAFPFQKHGTLSGTVRVISEDAFSRPPAENRQELSPSFYRARITIAESEDNRYDLMKRLIPGMEVQAEIRVGTRRIIEYLVNPLIKSLDEAIHEP